jgi:hypothetical protein
MLYVDPVTRCASSTPVFKRSRRKRQSSRRHFRNGRRAAVVRALTAVKLHDQGYGSLAAAAAACGSNAVYVAAMARILQSEDQGLLHQVLGGWIPVLAAATTVRRRADLVRAYRTAEPVDRVAAARAIGAETIFNVLVEASA